MSGLHASRTCPLRTAMAVGSGGWEGQTRPGHDPDRVAVRVHTAAGHPLHPRQYLSQMQKRKSAGNVY